MTDLFAGLPVTDLKRAVHWYEALLGGEPAFYPNDVEAVFEVVEHGYVYVEVRPELAGRGFVTLFVDDLGRPPRRDRRTGSPAGVERDLRQRGAQDRLP